MLLRRLAQPRHSLAVRACPTRMSSEQAVISPPRIGKAPLFNTYVAVKGLTDAGLPEQQAVKVVEALIAATVEAQDVAFSSLASKVCGFAPCPSLLTVTFHICRSKSARCKRN